MPGRGQTRVPRGRAPSSRGWSGLWTPKPPPRLLWDPAYFVSPEKLRQTKRIAAVRDFLLQEIAADSFRDDASNRGGGSR